jgi:hypothetical protein
MRKNFLFLLLLFAGMLAGCSGPADPGVTPAVDRFTFLFFYTDG